MKTSLTSLLLLPGLVSLLAPDNARADQAAVSDATNAPAPKIEFASTTYNFGKVKSGEIVKATFVFTNSGSSTLEILAVKPGCGCTTAGTWDTKVEPGKTGSIPLQFNSTAFGGAVSKSATVTCNDPVRSNIFLQITGTVWKPIDVNPTMVSFTSSSENPTNETKTLRVINNMEEPVALSDLQCNSPAFKAEIKEVKPGKEFELRVTTVPPFTTPSVYSTITLKTSSSNMPVVTLTAFVTVQEPVAVSPQQIRLPAGRLTSTNTTSVLVRNNGTNALSLSDLQVDIPGIEAKLAETQPGRVYTISLSFPPGFELKPDQKPVLTFKTSHPKFSLVKVPIIQIQPVTAATAPKPRPPGANPPQFRTASPTAPPAPKPAAPPAPTTGS